MLKRTLLLIDSRHGIKEIDREVMKMLDDAAVSYRLVLTKADKIKASELAEVDRARPRRRRASTPPPIPRSSPPRARTGLGMDRLRAAVLEAAL